MEILLEVKSLCKSYKKDEILKDVNLKIKKGDVYGLIGPNGAGKSTAIKSILGLVKKNSGEIYFDGKLIDSSKHINNLIGATIEEPTFYEYLSGYTNLKLHANLHNLPDERINEVLELVNLTNAKNKKVGKYSMGMKQRLAIARAFINHPKLIILDEPTNGLDPNGVLDLRELIKKQAKEGVTFIYCSHILSEVQNICNRVGLINNGQIVAEDSTSNLISNNTKVYVIKCEEQDKLLKYLKLNKFIVKLVGNKIEVEIKEDMFSILNQTLVNSGYIIKDISKKEYSLEDLFINKVGGSK